MTKYLPTIIELHETVTELRKSEEWLDGIPDWMQELHQEHSSRKAEIDELEAAIAEATQERRGTEGQINEIREKVKHYQEQISLVRNQREYGALLQEIDGAKEEIKGLEEQALAAMERQEEAERQLQEIRSRIEGGESFEALALELSEDPGSRELEGDLGFFESGQGRGDQGLHDQGEHRGQSQW